MTTIDTSTRSTASGFSNQRKVARTSSGRVWTAFHNGSDLEFWYSDDEGSTFTQNTSATITGGDNGTLFIDPDDHAHVAYERSGNSYYRRMANIGTSTAWGSEITIGGFSPARPDVWAHREGTGWMAHIVAVATDKVCHGRVVTTSAGSSSVAQSFTQIMSFVASNVAACIDGYHTGDAKTVQGGTPHLFVAATSDQTGTGEGVGFRKATYSGGTWTWGTHRTLDSSSYASSRRIAASFDGARFVVAYVDSGSTTDIKIRERDAADTTTTTRTPTALSDGAVTALSISYDADADIHLWAVGTTSDDVKRIEYDRSAGTWAGSWTTVATADAQADTLSLKRGYSGSTIDAIYTTGTGSPWDVVFATAAINGPPTAATWDLTDNQAHDVAATLTLDWTFNDPDAGDTQSKYALRRQIGAAAYEYWNAGTTSWGATEVENTSSTTQVALASSWGSDSDSNHKYAVKTWDAAGLEGTYSSDLTVIPSAKDNPTISSPADAGTVTGPSVTATWSATTQTAYKARLLTSGSAELESSGWVTSTATSHAFAYTLENSTSYKVEVTTKNDEGLASDADTNSFTVSFTPPATPTLVVTGSAANGYVSVAITNPGTGATESYNDVYVRVASGGRADIDRPVGGDGIRIGTGTAVDGTFTDYAVASGTSYEYRVQAVADTGATAWSAWT